MGTKTITIPHEGGHFLPEAVLESELAKAVADAGVPEGWTVQKSVTVAGEDTRVTVAFEGELGEPVKPEVETKAAEPVVLAGETKDQAAKARGKS